MLKKRFQCRISLTQFRFRLGDYLDCLGVRALRQSRKYLCRLLDVSIHMYLNISEFRSYQTLQDRQTQDPHIQIRVIRKPGAMLYGGLSSGNLSVNWRRIRALPRTGRCDLLCRICRRLCEEGRKVVNIKDMRTLRLGVVHRIDSLAFCLVSAIVFWRACSFQAGGLRLGGKGRDGIEVRHVFVFYGSVYVAGELVSL